MRAILSSVLVCAMCVPGFAQTPELKPYQGSGAGAWFKRPYLPQYSRPVDFSNSPRLERLMRAGNIYLSLQDAISLALENNLNIEYARYSPKLADTDVLRASAGQLLRNTTDSIRSGASSAAAGGALGAANAAGNTSVGASTTGGQSTILSGVSVQLAGSSIPNLDPTAFVNYQGMHRTQPLTNSLVTGTNFLVSGYRFYNGGISQGFLSGTNVQLSWNNTGLRQNSPTNDINPSTTSSLNLQVVQHLLQGFGWATNSRAIKIAKNNRHVSDLTFKGQVMATIGNVIGLYWDLVAFNDNLKVRRLNLELSTRLYEDNKKRAALGAIAPIDIVTAESEMEAAKQDVTNAETSVYQQEIILKNELTRTGLDSLAIAEARIIPTDRPEVPETEPVEPLQDLISEAIARRPEIEQSKIQLENSRISIRGTRSALLPSLDAFAVLTNNALAGDVNTIPYVVTPAQIQAGVVPVRNAGSANSFFLGGYGTVLSQLFARNFPDYSAGFQLNVTLRNRSAQADLAKDQLNYRQQQINDRQMQNNIRRDVINSRMAMTQARAAYDTAVKARKLQEQTLAGERRKFELGQSSFLNVLIVQRDLMTRQNAEVSALNAYARARVSVEQVTGRILEKHDVSIEEATTGVVKREPAIPVLDPGK